MTGTGTLSGNYMQWQLLGQLEEVLNLMTATGITSGSTYVLCCAATGSTSGSKYI